MRLGGGRRSDATYSNATVNISRDTSCGMTQVLVCKESDVRSLRGGGGDLGNLKP
jgi:hypothetical protein